MATRLSINSGPSKWDLMISLMQGNTKVAWGESHSVDFQIVVSKEEKSELRATRNKNREGISRGIYGSLDTPPHVPVQIRALARKDGSYEDWAFRGTVGVGEAEDLEVAGEYSTKTREGFIGLVDEDSPNT